MKKYAYLYKWKIAFEDLSPISIRRNVYVASIGRNL